MTACLDGDAEAWATLVHRYDSLVYAIARRNGLDAEAADDVFQEVFLSLLGSIASLENRQGVGKWLITTTHRVSWRAARGRQREQSLGERADPPAGPEMPGALLEEWERRHLVGQAMEEIGDRCRALLQALYGEADVGSDAYTHVAEKLGIPIGSIGPTRARCLRKLHDVYQRLTGPR